MRIPVESLKAEYTSTASTDGMTRFETLRTKYNQELEALRNEYQDKFETLLKEMEN